ncbi:hypothetical protein F0Q45_08405 [Mycobacterium simiae]|uniref:Uncharacterized protein n=1 Tax=Mycobacterium simiae TaxID=1784 RepID=A0A5B1BSK1_MYCSI|nr:hypothetical protein [Mycobacterium simiae]KAA1250705.1 hypothetical protein F0Q45_08405 [Mycobacterium simiae]
MNEQAAKLTRWLLAGNGALKNVAQLLTEAFGPVGAIAAAIDASTITAYPVEPGAEPQGQGWTPAAQGWTHPLHSQLLPRSSSAAYHVVAGITSRNEVLVVNLAAADYIGIEGNNPVLLMRSWLMQTLAKTPTASVAVTDSALAVPGAERLIMIDDLATAPAGTSLIFSTRHTSAPVPGQPQPITVSSQAAGAANVVLCNEAVAGIYLTDRYWPIWRRMEVADQQWQHLKTVLALPPADSAAATSQVLDEPQEKHPVVTAAQPDGNGTRVHLLEQRPDPVAAPQQLEHESTPTLPDETALTSTDSASPSPGQTPRPAAEPHHPTAPTSANDTSLGDVPIPADAPAPAPTRLLCAGNQEPPVPSTPPLLTPDIPAPFTTSTDSLGDDSSDNTPLLPGRSAEEPTEPGLYVLGTVYALGLDPDTKDLIKHSAVTRQGVRKPVKALMALATSNGVTPTEWEEKILQVTPQNRRQLRTQIRKMMGGTDPIRNDARGLLVADMFCDWKEFNRLIGHTPETATTEALTAAVQLIRGAPFEDVPDEDYSWRSVQLLKDELIDRCSTAATELAQRQQAAGAHEAAYQTARLGLRVYAQREDLWLVAANSVTDTNRKALIWDLKHAIPVPTHPELRQLLAASRAS